MDKWNQIKYQLPEEGRVVYTKMDDENGVRMEQKLIYSERLWWDTKKTMYVYYTPTHWRY